MTVCIDVTLPPQNYRAQPLVVVAAGILIDADGRVLLTSRPAGKSFAGMWEFPGGKLESQESPEQALVRELREELGITTTIGCLSPLSFVSHAYETCHVLMPVFSCRVWDGIPTPREAQKLAWVTLREMAAYELLPADRPLAVRLRELLAL
ncbi:MAG: (deoxy)nucleoside triphosphate pyrophosphohydrolase [Alphaproteobacteria bacterium]